MLFLCDPSLPDLLSSSSFPSLFGSPKQVTMTVSSSSSDDNDDDGELAATASATPRRNTATKAIGRRILPIPSTKRRRSTRGGSNDDDEEDEEDQGRRSNGSQEDQQSDEEGGSAGGKGSNAAKKPHFSSQAKRRRRSSSVNDSEDGGTHTAVDNDAASTSSTVSFRNFRWLDVGEIVVPEESEPTSKPEDNTTARARRVHPKGIEIGPSHKSNDNNNNNNGSRPFQVRPGLYVQLEAPTRDQVWICRVLDLWEPVDDLDARNEGDHNNNNENETDGKSHVTVASSVAAESRVRGQWLYNRHDIAQLQGQWTNGILTKEELLNIMLPGEYVISNQIDDNPVASILRTVEVVHPTTPQDKNHNSTAASASARELIESLSENQCYVRYRIRKTQRSWKLEVWTPEDDASSAVGPANGGHPNRAKAPHHMDESLSSDDTEARRRDSRPTRKELDRGGGGGGDDSDDDDDDDDSDDDTPSYLSGDDGGLAAMPEGEGSILRASTSVGPKHQVSVPNFVRAEAVRSRNPQLVWKAHAVSEADLQHYLHELATLLNPHQRERGLTLRDPYSPRPADETERAILQDARDHPPHHREQGLAQLQPTGSPWIRTGSHVSSASRLSLKPNALLKECDADAALLFLHDHQYDAGAALAAVRADPARILPTLTRAFTNWEKRVFDEGFRGSQGSLSRVASAMDVPMTSVVDYWYRFKIPDQFRQYRNKKREHAIRMVECIEKRRYYDFAAAAARSAASWTGTATATLATGSGLSVADPGQHPPRDGQHWSDLSMNDVTGAVEERRQKAKALLLEVDQRLGRAALGKVASAVRVLIESHSAAVKEELLATLGGCPDLQRRFQEFLPAQG